MPEAVVAAADQPPPDGRRPARPVDRGWPAALVIRLKTLGRTGLLKACRIIWAAAPRASAADRSSPTRHPEATDCGPCSQAVCSPNSPPIPPPQRSP